MDDIRSRSRSSVDVVVDNDDLLSTILLFVPAKRLICMKPVCKRWKALVSAEQFRCLHALHHRSSDPPPSFIIRANEITFFHFSPAYKISRPYKFCFPHTKILQSSYGLLLLEIRNSLYGAKHYYVYNPTTGESRFILKGSRSDKRASVSGLCLAFDPKRSSSYKVVSIRRDKKFSSLYWIEVYHSRTRLWIHLEKPFNATDDANFFQGNFWNNGICWIRRIDANSLYLDLETGIVGTPPRLLTHKRCNIGSRKNYVMESNGHLHYVSLYSGPKNIILKVSELLNDLVWIEKYNVNLNPVATEFQEMLGSQVAVLCIARGDKEEDSAVFFLMPEKIIFYRFCDGYFKDLFHLPTEHFYFNDHLHYQRNHAYQFIESLVPV